MDNINSFNDFLNKMQGLIDETKKQLKNQVNNNMGISEAIRQELKNNLDNALEKETQESWNKFLDEQKSVDNVEHKFHEGDWIVFNGLILYIDEVINGYYWTTSIVGIHNSYDWDIDNLARLWTILEAKEGDVLATEDSVFIFKYTHNEVCKSYCEVIGNSELGLGFEFSINGIHPAAKKQRDFLFQKIKEAGYKWDAEKKELEKIEQNPVWSKDDEIMWTQVINEIEAIKSNSSTVFEKNIAQDKIDWLKSVKDRIQIKVELTQLNKNILEAAIAFVEQNKDFYYCKGVDKNTVLSALYSLKPQNT